MPTGRFFTLKPCKHHYKAVWSTWEGRYFHISPSELHGLCPQCYSYKNGFPRKQNNLIYDTINRREGINMKWRKFTRWLYSFNFYASTLYHYESIQLLILSKLVKLFHLEIYVLDFLQIWNIIVCELYSEYSTSESL